MTNIAPSLGTVGRPGTYRLDLVGKTFERGVDGSVGRERVERSTGFEEGVDGSAGKRGRYERDGRGGWVKREGKEGKRTAG